MYFFLLILLLAAISIRRIRSAAVSEHGIDMSLSLWLRGILVLLVVFHHLNLSLMGSVFLEKLAISCGKYAVCLFFFLSGYGLMLQYQKKGREMFESYGRNRFSKLLIPIVLATAAYAVFYYVRDGHVKIPDSWGALEWYVPFSWFVYALAAMYLLFWGLFRFLSARWALCSLYGILLLLMAIADKMPLNTHWWISLLSFPIGCTFACAERQLAARRRVLLLAAVVLLSLRTAVVALFGVDPLWAYALMAVPGVLAVAWCFVPLLQVRQRSMVTFLGTISYEIYLYQGMGIAWVSPLRSHSLVYSLALFVVLCVIGWMTHKCNALIISRCLVRG